MRFRLFTCCILSLLPLYAPAQTDVTGRYRHPHDRDPSGTPTLFILPGGRFLVAYFGGVQAGNWSMDAQQRVTLRPDQPPAAFLLYGRHNPDLGSRTRIFYAGFQDHPALVQTGPGAAIRPVFNEDANCVPFPSVDTLDGLLAELSLISRPYDAPPDSRAFYTFPNTQGDNDFVAYHLDQEHAETTTMYWRNGKLYRDHGDDEGAPQEALNLEGDDVEFVRTFAALPRVPDTVLYNPWYNNLEELPGMGLAAYRYDPAKNAYLSPDLGYVADMEQKPEPEGFDYFNSRGIVYAFVRVKPASAVRGKAVAQGPPVFQHTCGE